MLRKSIKGYFSDLGYWGFIVIAPILLDAIGIYQLAIDNQFTGVPSWIWFVIAFLILLIIPFVAYHKKYLKLEEIENKVRLKARPGSMRINITLPSEPPLKRDEFSIYTTIHFEVWTDIDIQTARLALNVVGKRYVYWRKFWHIFLPKYKRMLGIPIDGQDTHVYRKQIKQADKQPFEDNATFKWRGNKSEISWGDCHIYELALDLGSPNRILRAVIDPELYGRGMPTPL